MVKDHPNTRIRKTDCLAAYANTAPVPCPYALGMRLSEAHQTWRGFNGIWRPKSKLRRFLDRMFGLKE
jgi:hypothetical protein